MAADVLGTRNSREHTVRMKCAVLSRLEYVASGLELDLSVQTHEVATCSGAPRNSMRHPHADRDVSPVPCPLSSISCCVVASRHTPLNVPSA